ncbi:polymorphic toxin type 50 domain-containing protein [Actinotignum schaalii]
MNPGGGSAKAGPPPSFTATTRGTIHYSKSGCHLVPTHPKE